MTVVTLSGAALVKLNFIFPEKKMRNDLWDLTVSRKAESGCQKPKKITSKLLQRQTLLGVTSECNGESPKKWETFQ